MAATLWDLALFGKAFVPAGVTVPTGTAPLSRLALAEKSRDRGRSIFETGSSSKGR